MTRSRCLPSRLLACVAGILVLLAALPALALGMDRAALEELFGESVTTSASGKPQRASDVPLGMDIITAEQIRRSGAHDIPAVLARYTSLDVHQYNASDYAVGVRGYATPMTPRLLVLVNGRQVYLDHYGYAAWDAIPVQLGEIRQIEVVKGPNSALFGFNAVAGVVNIITYDPSYEHRSNAVVRLGTGGYRETSGVVSAPLGDGGGLRLSAGLRGEHNWGRGYTDFERASLDAGRSPTRAQFAGEAAFRLGPAARGAIDASFGRNIGAPFADYGQFWREDKRIWSLRGRVEANTSLGLVEAQIYRNAFRATYAATPFVTDHSVTVAELSDTVKLGAAHTLRPMVEFRRATMDIGASKVVYDIAAAGAMWNWAVTDRVETTLALRYDHLWLNGSGYDDPAFPYGDRDYDRNFGTATWNFGLVWRATDDDTFRLGAARGVGLPTLYDLGWRDSYPAFGYQDTGNPYLGPTVVTDYQLEYRRRIEAIDGRFSITGFHQRNRGFSSGLSAATHFPPDVAYETYTPYALGRSDVTGFDLSLRGRALGAIDWGVEYRLAAVSSEFRPSLLDPKRASPRHLVSARLGWSSGPLELNLFGRYASLAQGYRTVNEADAVLARSKDYVSVAARIAYRLTDRMTLALEGENLLHERQEQTYALKAERRFYLSLRADF
ncbi:iron complex outermembrane recepter protein [Roseomonas rosea]|uniref:Iron complex outermembrane recepter protein n=1 Tax=Muricoccus roseus TaxID=198092 RepID=A0A1M6D7Q1_9PROT|nr:TonB-dependent receptor [Roseomonas rosea]SHI69018.1 iron complex outermembrane recepter protein [Roseomonas rosea]